MDKDKDKMVVTPNTGETRYFDKDGNKIPKKTTKDTKDIKGVS